MQICELCDDDSALNYYGHEICGKCWAKHCSGMIDLKERLKIKKERQIKL